MKSTCSTPSPIVARIGTGLGTGLFFLTLAAFVAGLHWMQDSAQIAQQAHAQAPPAPADAAPAGLRRTLARRAAFMDAQIDALGHP